MKPVYVPNYYAEFHCIASACRHSCCVGWEIDVDEDALARYDTVGGELGRRLQEGIDRESDPPCFRLTPDEKCPFLNPSGLCDLITELGEDSLCHICDDHPRFRNVANDRVELGLGLCCEAAASLILGQTELFSVVELSPEEAAHERFSREEPDGPDPIADRLLVLRSALLNTVQNRTMPLSDRIRHLYAVLDINLSWTTAGRSATLAHFGGIAALLRSMERLDPAWDACLDALATLPEDPLRELDGEDSTAYEQLLCYFLYRYMAAEYDGRPDMERVRALFAVLSTALIHAVHRATGGEDLESLCEIARMFSSEIEYSEENVERLMDEIEDALL